MSTSPTLADMVIRESYRPHTTMRAASSRSMSSIRTAIAEAHKFVLDDEMSAFVADLAHGPYIKDPRRSADTLTSMRRGARLPHSKVWIEIRGRALKERTAKLHSDDGREILDPWGNTYSLDDPAAESWGFLIESEEGEEFVRAVEFLGNPEDGGEGPILIPTQIAWSPYDRHIFDLAEYKKRAMSRGEERGVAVADSGAVVEILSVLAHGIQGYYDPCILSIPDSSAPGYERFPMVEFRREADMTNKLEIPCMVAECSGIGRYLLALLSTINDIPVVRTDVKPSKGYVARGSYKKFVEHTVVRLNVPQRVSRTRLAAKITAVVRRRAHEVRGHWRLYQRGEGVMCAPSLHSWGAADAEGHAQCGACSAWRTWIDPHQRGDASLGFVTHSYAVTHDDSRAQI